MPQAGLETTNTASERPMADALHRAAIGVGKSQLVSWFGS